MFSSRRSPDPRRRDGIRPQTALLNHNQDGKDQTSRAGDEPAQGAPLTYTTVYTKVGVVKPRSPFFAKYLKTLTDAWLFPVEFPIHRKVACSAAS